MSNELTVEEWVFVAEYIIDGNASRAVIASGYTGHYAGDAGYRMLKRPNVMAELARSNDALRRGAMLKAEMVTEDIANVLRADPRDLIQFVTGACRYCHGRDHEYQRTRGEMSRDRRQFYSDPSNENKPFDTAGGEGFDAYRDPHPDCPECAGRGVQKPQLKDTRTLSPETASLYAGIRQTKHGLEFILRSKDAAREAAAKYLGMNKETVDINLKKKVEDFTDEELIAMLKEQKP